MRTATGGGRAGRQAESRFTVTGRLPLDALDLAGTLMRTHLIRDARELPGLEPQWRAAEARGHVPSVFVTFDWVSAYWKVYGQDKDLWLVLGEAGGQIRALAPLMICHAMAGSLRRLELVGAGIHDYSDFVVPPESPDAAGDLWLEILERRDAWDSLRFRQLAEHSPALEHVCADPEGLRRRQTLGEACPTLQLPASWDAYVAMLGPNMRYALRRYERQLLRDFNGVRVELASTHGGVDRALDVLIRLHGARWRQRGLPGMLATNRRQRFQRDLCHRLLERDRLRLFTLELNGSTAAVLLNYAHGGRHFFYLSGFDPALARYRLGFVLLGRAIRAAIEEHATEFDFLRGREDYKYRLGATDRAYYDLSMMKPGLRSRASATGAQVEDRVVGWARAVVQRRVRAGVPTRVP